MTKWIVSVVLLLNGVHSFACLEKLNSSLLYKSFQEKQEILKKLKKKDMACLFEESRWNEKPRLSFFLPPKKRQAMRVQKFFGVNSFPIFKAFEKHFFTIDTLEGDKIFGYNKSKIEFLGGPGFFEVKTNEENGDIYIDYGEDFKSIIPIEKFNAWKGRSVSKIKNNKRSIVYGGGLKDNLHQLNDKMVIGRGFKITKTLKKNKTVGYFVLLKK
ncbi:MAG: hypothetical protein VXY34_05905 [Bdellovibrionota bacterium]|nr:hypothetical protein [Bdellovibrionota bacterium]